MRSLVVDGIEIAPCILFAVIALHVFRRSTVPASVEVNRHKCDSRRGQSVAFRQDCGLRGGLSWFQGLVIVLLSVFHGLILPNWGRSGLICSRRSFRARNRTTVQCSTAPDVLAEALPVSGSICNASSSFDGRGQRSATTAIVLLQLLQSTTKNGSGDSFSNYSVSTRTSPNFRKS